MDHLRPSTPTSAPDTESDRETFWTAIGVGFTSLALAVGVHVPGIWAELADAEAQGRRSGVRHLLAAIGPWPITVVFGGLALVVLLLGRPARRRSGRVQPARRGTAEE